MIPVNQFILGSSDPLLYPSENNGTTQNQQVPTQGIWDAFDGDKVWEYFHMNN